MKLCVIPARGGSKRIPRKNIKSFAGKPVIAHPIHAAVDSGLFDRVIVSTEDHQIAQVAESIGAEVPFFRPTQLADDYTGTRAVLIHAVEWYLQAGHSVDQLCCLYPVTPFVSAQLLSRAYKAWRDSEAEYCMSVAPFPSSPYRALYKDERGRVSSIWPEHRRTRTQDLPDTFYDVGMFYFCNTETLLRDVSFHSNVTHPYILPRYLAHDIDTPEDWEIAEAFYQLYQKGVFVND